MKRQISGSRAILLLALVLIGVAALYFFFDPASSRLAPKCIFHAVTGWDCPGCGSQRMIHALLHGDFRAAWQANAFLLCASPLIAMLAVTALYRTKWPRLYRTLNSLPVIIAVAVALMAWTVGRNIL